MTHTIRIILTAGIGVLTLQGCAQTQSVKQSTTVPAVAAPLAQPSSGEAIPEVDGKPTVNANTGDKFEVVAVAVRQQMQPGGRWQFVDKNERVMIDDSFADMSKLFGQFGSVDKMDDNAKVRLFADHYLTQVASLASPGLDELRWLKPVRPGDTLSIRVTVLKAVASKSKPDRGVVTSGIEVLNQADEIVMTLKAVNFIGRRPPS